MSNKELISEAEYVEREFGESYLSDLVARLAKALAAVSDTTPSEQKREIHEPSFDRVYCVRCGATWPCQPTPSEGEREAAFARIRAKLDRIPDSDAVTLDKADVRAVLAHPAPVDRGKLLRQIETTLACTEHMLYEERAEQIVRLFGPAVTAFPTLGVPTESPESGSVAATVQAGLDAPVDREKLLDARRHLDVIKGAQNDMLNGRPDLDAMEEIALSLRLLERDLDAALAVSPAPARDEWEYEHTKEVSGVVHRWWSSRPEGAISRRLAAGPVEPLPVTEEEN